MTLRLILLIVLFILIARAFWRVVDGVIEGLGGKARTPVHPAPGVPMVRDPVCGTFVLPDRAVSLTSHRQQLFFCSTACRDKYRAELSGRPESGEGRTA
ncbi:MAG: YHS domain-containing protein [Acidobacteria bacterium]|nr:YHS domain-containing protein [Acidobacteriota bacterium]